MVDVGLARLEQHLHAVERSAPQDRLGRSVGEVGRLLSQRLFHARKSEVGDGGSEDLEPGYATGIRCCLERIFGGNWAKFPWLLRDFLFPQAARLERCENFLK